MITPNNFMTSVELAALMYDRYGLTYDSYDLEYPRIFGSSIPTSKAYEEHVGMSGFNLIPEKGIGINVSYADPKQGFKGRINQTVYGLGFAVAKEMFLWEQWRLIEALPKALANSVQETRETLAILTLDRAFNSSYSGADGKELCATDHVRESDGAAWKNEPSSAMDLNFEGWEQALIDIASYTSPSGLKIKSKPRLLATGVNNNRMCAELFGSQKKPDTANNEANYAYNAVPYMISHYLTSTKSWFILLEGDNGLVNFTSRKPDFTQDNEFNSEVARFKVVFNEAFSWEDPRRIYGSPGVS